MKVEKSLDLRHNLADTPKHPHPAPTFDEYVNGITGNLLRVGHVISIG
jgi:hypothetical protein